MDIAVAIVIIVAVLAAAAAITVVARRRSAEQAPRDATPTAEAPRLRSRLAKSRHALADRLSALAGRGRPGDEFWADVEDLLVSADVGVGTAADLVAAVRQRKPDDREVARVMLQEELEQMMAGRDRRLRLVHRPSVVLVVGVNGGGKTTSIAKLAARLQRDGAAVLLGAADTYRAAADQQLRTWADRIGADIVGGQAGADPAAVAYDAFQAARARDADAVIVDTAGRLQSRANLMAELSKVARVLRREAGEIDETLLVIDGTTGQNAVSQARIFSEAVGVTGIVITKLDGTARGGVAVSIERDLDIPVKLIGVGEGLDDLIPFDPHEFVDALLGS